MSDTPATTAAAPESAPPDMKLFWACFIALIATAFGFIIRAFLMGTWQETYGFTPVERGEIFGVGLWPFAISIVLFSLVIDRIGYGTAMIFAFLAHITSAVLTILVPSMVDTSAGLTTDGHDTAYTLLYWANFIVALGNGTIEAVVNPVVATMFARDKTKWLNILHAGWPGGLVLAGLLTIGFDQAGIVDWRYKVALMFLPVIAYGVMMLGAKFPVNERVTAGVTYLDMLKEFGMGGALLVSFLMFNEAGRFFGVPEIAIWISIVAATVAFGFVVKFAIGRPLFLILLLIMIPLATTELGIDSWITSLMEPQMEEAGRHAGWVLVYTSLIMLVLRFFAGSIIHRISPLGLLAVSAGIAAGGLYFFSEAKGLAMIFAAASVYGIGKTFFWPTMLGVVAEQFPRGGALTLNAAGGVGMLGVGVIGNPLLGLMLGSNVEEQVASRYPEVVESVITEKKWAFGTYNEIDGPKLAAVSEEKMRADLGIGQDDDLNPALADYFAENDNLEVATVLTALEAGEREVETEAGETVALVYPSLQSEIGAIESTQKQRLLSQAIIFPIIMLLGYLGLIAYFKTRGGYQAEVITADDGSVKEIVNHTPADPVPEEVSAEQFTGGVEGPAGR